MDKPTIKTSHHFLDIVHRSLSVLLNPSNKLATRFLSEFHFETNEGFNTPSISSSLTVVGSVFLYFFMTFVRSFSLSSLYDNLIFLLLYFFWGFCWFEIISVGTKWGSKSPGILANSSCSLWNLITIPSSKIRLLLYGTLLNCFGFFGVSVEHSSGLWDFLFDLISYPL